MTPETMKRRLSRAKARIKTTGIPFTVPPEHLLARRLAAVLAVVYLIFNQVYGGRVDLAAEAIRLGRLLSGLLPGEPEVHGLLALMLCHDARRSARFSDSELVLLEHQDRSLWDAAQIEEGRAALDRVLAQRGRGPYVLQGAIASLQIEERIDWPQVVALYGELGRLTRSLVVELNRAVAVAQTGSPQAALRIVEELELDGYPYLERADVLGHREASEPEANATSATARHRRSKSDGSNVCHSLMTDRWVSTHSFAELLIRSEESRRWRLSKAGAAM